MDCVSCIFRRRFEVGETDESSLATYTQVRNHFPSRQVMDNLHRQYEDDPKAFALEFKKEAKDLFHINWFRVILDEAHCMTKWNGISKSTYDM